MCLRNPTSRKPKIARKDMVCYKFLRVHRSWFDPDGTKYISAPYRTHFQYKLGEVTRLHYSIPLQRDSYGDVEEGFHSFKNWEKTLELAEERNRRDQTQGAKREYFVFVCLIPKGAKYFLGDFAGEDSYASDALIVLSRNSRRSKEYVKNAPPTAQPVF